VEYFLIVQDECREWDINEVIFSKAMWPMYQPMLRADFTFFDQYDFAHEVLNG
jgi:surfactin synthase thioesterase subunit